MPDTEHSALLEKLVRALSLTDEGELLLASQTLEEIAILALQIEDPRALVDVLEDFQLLAFVLEKDEESPDAARLVRETIMGIIHRYNGKRGEAAAVNDKLRRIATEYRSFAGESAKKVAPKYGDKSPKGTLKASDFLSPIKRYR